MEEISAVDADVSSSDAACSDAPCARDWLDAETCPAAPATCVEPSFNSLAARLSALLILRIKKKARKLPTNTAAPIMIQTHSLPVAVELETVFISSTPCARL